MKAVGYRKSLPIDDAEALTDVTIEAPEPKDRDLRVAVRAVSVNPVDTKVRRRAAPPAGGVKVLGYDAAGVVDAVGPQVTLFKPGDEVYYAGSIVRPGTNAEFHLVDERIVGHKPKSLSFTQAAAMPLTTITAWELLFDRLEVRPGKAVDLRALLVIGGAGGVGSMLIQLASRLTGLTVIATASRPETREWCLKLGAHHVVDHTKSLVDEMKAIGHPQAALIAGLTGTEQHYPAIAEIIAPQGKFALIDDPASLDVTKLKGKSASLHWESMFTRSSFATPDMVAQHRLLDEVAALVDAGVIVTTLAQELSPINAANLRRAHALVESGRSKGKVVVTGW
jgi:zinc-binding alcohol dehydrogenase family protein